MPIRVVTGLLIRDDKILMCLRHEEKSYYPLHWEFPGGKVETGESLYQALFRELQEELNISVNDATIWFEDTMSYSNGMIYHVSFYSINSFEGEPVNTEFQEIRWINVHELDSLQHLSGNINIIRKLKEEGLPK